MAKPLLLREKSAAGWMLSFRWGRLSIDVLRKRKEIVLIQFGHSPTRFLCRLDPSNEDPPIFLFDKNSEITWNRGTAFAGSTTKPISFDKYWRSRGWITKPVKETRTAIGSGTESAKEKGFLRNLRS